MSGGDGRCQGGAGEEGLGGWGGEEEEQMKDLTALLGYHTFSPLRPNFNCCHSKEPGTPKVGLELPIDKT